MEVPMQFERRTITQTIKVPAGTGRTADEYVRTYLEASTRVMHSMDISVWPAVVSEPQQDSDDVLMQILRDAVYPDAVEDADGYVRSAYVNVDETDIPDLLIAWRDAAVKAALEDADDLGAPVGVREPVAALLDYDDGMRGFGLAVNAGS
jgi:hypothetical protein